MPSLVSPAYFYTYGFGSSLGGYGYQPGSQVYSLSTQWRGRYLDWTGFIYKGARYYDYQSGKFLSCDPMGHDGSMSLYDYCGGDPVNNLDPDGRLASYAANTVESSVDSFGNSVSNSLGSALNRGLNSWAQASNDQSATWQALTDPNTRAITAETMFFSGERSISNFAFRQQDH